MRSIGTLPDIVGFLDRMHQRNYKRFWTSERLFKAAEIQLTPGNRTSIVEEQGRRAGRKGRGRALSPAIANRVAATGESYHQVWEISASRILHYQLSIPSFYNTYLNTGLLGPIRIPDTGRSTPS